MRCFGRGDRRLPRRLGLGVERIGRRLSLIKFADEWTYHVLDQVGMPLFTNNFVPNAGAVPALSESLIREIREEIRRAPGMEPGAFIRFRIDPTGWVTVIEQPKSVAYKPLSDLVNFQITVASSLVDCTNTSSRDFRGGVGPSTNRGGAPNRARSHLQRKNPRQHAERHRAGRSRLPTLSAGE